MVEAAILLELLFHCVSSICQAKVLKSLVERIPFLTPINYRVINLLKYSVINGFYETVQD